jgi:beta-N-acetylhexosaminidase
MHGLHSAGVLAVGKHFPGHGATLLDSHIALPVADRTLSQLEACELLPFRQAIAAGIEALMTAHVVYPAWDALHPATLSPAILSGVLRQQMAFRGVIVTDDLGMAGAAEALPWAELPVQALRAGANLLLICHRRQRQEQAYYRVLRAVQDGEISEALVDQAVDRVRELKERLQPSPDRGMAPATLECIGSAPHHTLSEAIRARASACAGAEQTHDE